MPDAPPPDKPVASKLPPDMQDAITKLAPWFREAGIEVPPEIDSAMPQIFVGERISVLAYAISQNLLDSGLYRAGKELVTVDEGTGEFQLMTAKRAISWLEDWVSFYRLEQGEKVFVSIARRKLEEVLASDAFLCKVRPLRGINMVKLPVRRSDGRLEWLQPGYDAESGIFTLRTNLDYPEDMDPDAAREYLLDLLKYFPFGDEMRSRAVQLLAMLTVYCSGMLPPTARPPIFIWNANQVGSGKTRLAQMALYPVFGTANLATWWDRNEDMKKELDSAAQDFVAYLFFDDRSGKLKSNLLNAFATSSRWSGRVMGTKERFYVTLRAVTFVTGNQLTYSDDMLRRAVLIDLFQPVQWDKRKLPDDATEITEEWLAADENRIAILSALCALVKHAEERERHYPAQLSRKLPSFEGWSAVIPKICVHALFGDPTEMPPAAQANPLLQDARDLALEALDKFAGGKDLVTIKLADLVPIARRKGLFVEILGTLDDVFRELDAGKGRWKQIEEVEVLPTGHKDITKREPTSEEKQDQAAAWIDRSMATIFGRMLKKMMSELQFADSAGNQYQFGSREGSRQATYVCRRIKEEEKKGQQKRST